MGPVETATRAELERMPAEIAESAIAASAVMLAQGMDSPASFTSKGMGAKVHREIMDRLRELAPPVEEKDELDDLAARRAQRLAARSSGTAN